MLLKRQSAEKLRSAFDSYENNKKLFGFLVTKIGLMDQT